MLWNTWSGADVGNSDPMSTLQYIYACSWSPDGEYFALIGQLPPTPKVQSPGAPFAAANDQGSLGNAMAQGIATVLNTANTNPMYQVRVFNGKTGPLS